MSPPRFTETNNNHPPPPPPLTANKGAGIKKMAELMAGFIQNCKLILSMLKYEIMFTNL